MATQCRGTKTKRINRHKLAVIQAYIIIGTLVLIGFIGGLVVGRATAPKKQVTVTETVEVPSYEADSLPVAEEVTYFDVPLSHSLQRYIYEVCADENVPVSLIIAMIDQESKFNPEVVSKTGDYGLMQINTINHEYIGDYWTIGGVNYRIAAFDYYLNSGDTNCTTHHVVIVPDTCLYNAQMHNTSSGGWESGAANTTAGGYVGSDMYKSNLEQAKTTIKSAFSGHVLKHRIYLTNAVANGRASGGAWCDSEVDLMCEQMVYGSGIFSPVSDGSNVPANYRVEKSQLPLFQHEPSRICNRATWWLRDVITASYFASVGGHGNASYGDASYSFGVRPAFCIS